MEKKYFWLVMDTTLDSKGMLHKPTPKNGSLPADRVPDAGEHVQRLLADPKARIAPEEINKIAFESQQAVQDYWNAVRKRIAPPQAKEVVASKPETSLKPKQIEDAGQSMIGYSPSESSKETVWIYEKDKTTGKLKPVEIEFLIGDQREATEADFQLAEQGEFPPGRLTKIAFQTKAELGRFATAYQRGEAKKKEAPK